MKMSLTHAVAKYRKAYPANEKKMEEVVEVIDDMMMSHLEKCDKDAAIQVLCAIHEKYAGPHFDEDFAMHQVEKMFHKDGKGNIHKGQHWTIEQTTDVMKSVKSQIPAHYNPWDWFVTMHMIWHDDKCLYKKWFPEISDEVLTQKVIEASVNYLTDIDAEEGKIWRRYY